MGRKSVKANSILNAARMGLTVLVPLMTFRYTSGIFLTEGSGKLSFAGSVTGIFALLASLGIYTYGVREGSKVRNDRAGISALASRLVFINLISTAAACIALSVMLFTVPAFHSYIPLILINSLNIVFPVLGVDWIFGVYEDYSYITIRQILVQIVTILAMFLFIHQQGDIYKWAVISSVSVSGANIFNFFYARKYIRLSLSNVRIRDLKQHLRPILLLFATQLAAKVYSNVDIVLLGLMSTNHHTGLYSAAVKINTILITCFSAMTPVFVPRIVEYIKEAQIQQYHFFLKKVFSLIIAFGLPCVVGLECLSSSVIELVANDSFLDAAVTIRVLSPVILITSCANILYYDVLVPFGKERQVLACTVLSGIVNIVISMALIPGMQENGAAAGSLLAELLGLGMAFSFANRTDSDIAKSLPKVKNYVLGASIVGIVCAAVCRVAEQMVLRVVLCVALGGFSYCLFLCLSKDFIGIEILTLLQRVRQRVLK